MKNPTRLAFSLCILTISILVLVVDESPGRANEPAAVAHGQAAAPEVPPSTTVPEARARAVLLYESMHGALQVAHRDLFDEDDAHAIPSASLEDVFDALAEQYSVELKWLIVETDIVNVDHQADDEFEKAAVVALKAGKPRHEAVEPSRYRFAGPIRLASQCLKCHVKHRTSTEDRTAGLLISMPLRLDQ
ncbi:hypothetical protein Mal15_53970 [Stieleria maiorica]|uniref:Tll0287-like domain-containing protein n=1 Tax=Stieleria maiorica TaxID=2795974 RepID=A0A5B9MMQ4_9BACT|nr:DUF3365 domain-containing protein [Stieleria maiorica]QEG01321.1 hypothetical protein Mal15_53970 [Stieleria maiorica]